ncbi:MAG: membrane protein insertion efficiency factor YidD [Acidobacteria bacterium]|nr:MAG: membrane protein insertion efficiency factor YidD [Acidobacteriota bacterium]
MKVILNYPIILVIHFYRKLISPMFPPTCRFYPSCSSYGLQAFRTFPFFKALGLTVWRVLRCNPWNPGGYDPLPGTEEPDKVEETA